MCVIVDANALSLVFAQPPTSDGVPVIDWIERDGGRLVYGGTKFCEELFKDLRARRQVKVWQQAGLVDQYRNADVDRETMNIRSLGLATSNDEHVLALARISGARVLISSDVALHADFRNKQIIDNPRGAIYQNASHKSLLQHSASCTTARKHKKTLFD